MGGLCGHQAGVTCVTPKGDGHHFISNGKDQTMKLWDIRRMLDPKDDKMLKAARTPQRCDAYRVCVFCVNLRIIFVFFCVCFSMWT